MGATTQFGDRMCLTCSWQRQSSVLVHMVSELGLDIPVVELDTQLFFRGDVRDPRPARASATASELVRPEVIGVAEQALREGANLWERDPDRCCHIRKVEPLERALGAVRRVDHGHPPRAEPDARRTRRRSSGASGTGVWKVQPIADWDAKRVQAYCVVNEIPVNPLHDAGYPSIGCIPARVPCATARTSARGAGRAATSSSAGSTRR